MWHWITSEDRKQDHEGFNDIDYRRLPRSEFIEQFEGKVLGKAREKFRLDLNSLWSCAIILYKHLSYSEFVAINLASLGMTLFFCYYLYPSQPEPYHLAARLKFNLIATAVLFPSTMLANETINRRESALRRFGTFKGELSNVLRAILLWRAPHVKTTKEWDQKAAKTFQNTVDIVLPVLLLPTIRDRHDFSLRGRTFGDDVYRHKVRHIEEFMKNNFEIHCLVEDLKKAGLSPMESMRLFQLITIFSKEFDAMLCFKVYRSPRTARAFVRIILTSCIMFYG